MKVGAFFLCLGKWLAVPVTLGVVGYCFVLPRIQNELELAKEKDAALFESKKYPVSSDFKPPVLDVIKIKKAGTVSDRITLRAAPRKQKPKPTETEITDSAPSSAPKKPIQSSPDTKPVTPPPTAPDPGSGPETIPVSEGG